MSVEENKAIVRAWLAARNLHDVEAAVTLWAENQYSGPKNLHSQHARVR